MNKTQNDFSNEWLLKRRITHYGYPASEARFASIKEYIEYLETENDCLNNEPHYWKIKSDG